MSKRSRTDSAMKALAEDLNPGESVEMVSVAMVGQLSVAKSVATGLVVAAATLGTFSAFVRPRKLFVILTNQRLLFLGANETTGRARRGIVMEFPREALSTQTARIKRALLLLPTALVDIAIAGMDKGIRLQFPMPARADGLQLGAALQPTS